MCYNSIKKRYIYQIEEHNNEMSPQLSVSSVLANGDQPASPTTSSDKSPPDSLQSSISGIQSGSGRPSNHEFGHSLQSRRAYHAVKFGIKGTDYIIVLKNAGTRHYQQLVNEFTSIMNDIVDETIGNADPNDYVRFVLKSGDFDRPLNTSYQRRSQVSGAWLSELTGKLLQCHESLDIDNNLTLHVQHVAIPRGDGRARVAVNMWTNILLKLCVLTNVAQYNHILCFGYALVLAINIRHQYPVFRVGLVDLPITNLVIHCSQGVHIMQ